MEKPALCTCGSFAVGCKSSLMSPYSLIPKLEGLYFEEAHAHDHTIGRIHAMHASKWLSATQYCTFTCMYGLYLTLLESRDIWLFARLYKSVIY
jgi:hypothetical protein